MARWTEHTRAPVDTLVDRWRAHCLLADESLDGPAAIWTLQNAEALVECFVDNPIEDNTKFIEKLELQLKGQSDAAIRLMAETIAVYLAFAMRAVGPVRKRELINEVLAFASDELDEDGLIWKGMSGAIGGPGQSFNSHRPFLLMYLVRFTSAIKAESSGRRAELVSVDSDPWGFRTWLDEKLGTPTGGAQTMRNILLHLLFSDHFERIAVDEDKDQIVKALGGLIAEENRSDRDRALLEIRQRLEQLLPDGTEGCDGQIDFYYSPLREGWDPDDNRVEQRRDAGSLSHIAALEHKKQVVLYGPPGTGKTHEAKELARQLIRRAAMRDWGPATYLQNADALEEVMDRQVERRQLHPAYTYEDFIGGLRLIDNSTVPVRGHLLRLVDAIEAYEAPDGFPPLPWVLILDELNRADLSRLLGEVFSALDDRDAAIRLSAAGSENWPLFRLPSNLYIIGTMNLIDQSVEQLDFALRRRFLWLLSDFRAAVIAPVVEKRWVAMSEQADNRHLKRHTWAHLAADIERLADRASALNDLIASSPLLGPEYRIGHTYFFDIVGFVARDPRLLAKQSQTGHYLWSGKGEPRSPLLDLWTYSLEPLLHEYLAGVSSQVRSAELKRLGDVFCAKAT